MTDVFLAVVFINIGYEGITVDFHHGNKRLLGNATVVTTKRVPSNVTIMLSARSHATKNLTTIQ